METKLNKTPSHTLLRDLRAWHDFTGFASATGLKAPQVGPHYHQFITWAAQYVLEHSPNCYEAAIHEAFEAWISDPAQSDLA